MKLLPLRPGLQPIKAFYFLDKATGRKCYVSDVEKIMIEAAA